MTFAIEPPVHHGKLITDRPTHADLFRDTVTLEPRVAGPGVVFVLQLAVPGAGLVFDLDTARQLRDDLTDLVNEQTERAREATR